MPLTKIDKNRLKKVEDLISLLQQNVKNGIGGGGNYAKNWLAVLGEAGDITATIKLLEALRFGNINIDTDVENNSIEKKSVTEQNVEINDNDNEVCSQLSAKLANLQKEVDELKHQVKQIYNEQKSIRIEMHNQSNDTENTKVTSKVSNQDKPMQKQEMKATSVFNKENDQNVRVRVEEKEIAQRPKIRLSDKTSEQMKKLVEKYNTLYENSRKFRTGFTLTLLDEEVNVRESNQPKSEDEKFNRPASLKQGGGNPNYYGSPINNDETKMFVFPATSIAINSDSLWTNAYAYFFEIKNKESIQPKDGITPYVLVRPAIVEKRQNDEYQLLLPGCIELR